MIWHGGLEHSYCTAAGAHSKRLGEPTVACALAREKRAMVAARDRSERDILFG